MASNTDWGDIVSATLAGLGAIIVIALILGTIIGGFLYGRHMKYENFQTTIQDLSEEQKCIHICGFQYPSGYFENYKFCMEKCDRISERIHSDCRT